MVIISGQSLMCFKEYNENKVKLKVVHFCPLDGRENDPKCKRIVITSDCSSPTASADVYLVVVFYGPLSKTPFKKSALKVGQLFTLQRFHTSVMPNNKVFKCNGHILQNFFEPLILVKPDFDPIIKMLVSLREETPISQEIDDSSDDNQQLVIDEDNVTKKIDKKRDSEQEVRSERSSSTQSPTRSPTKAKRMRLESTDITELSSDDDFDTDSRRRVLSNTRNVQISDNNPTIDENTERSVSSPNKRSKPVSQTEKPRSQTPQKEANSLAKSPQSKSPSKTRSLEYKTLMQIHTLMPVSGRTYCHVYGILVFRDYKQNTIYLRDEKVFKFSVSLRPGSYSREYPAAKPGDIIRIHRLLLAPNSLEAICTDPKDVVVFEGFRESILFSPIHTSISPTFDDFDKNRKQQLEEWLSDEMLTNDSLGQKFATAHSFFTDLAVQVIRVTPQRDRTYLEVWDTTEPALKTFKSCVKVNDLNMSQSEEELVRIINENSLSILVTVYEQHSIDATNLKPFDFIVLFNVNVRVDKLHKNCFTYSLNSTYNFGKCIRYVNPESCLGIKFSSRIEEYKLMSAVNVPEPAFGDQLPSVSQPIDFDDTQPLEDKTRNEETVLRDSFELQINHIDNEDLVPKRESCLPIERFVTVPDNNVLFSDVIGKAVHRQLYKVKARLISYLPNLELKDIVTVYCSKKGCERLITLSQAISENPIIQTVIESSTEEKIEDNRRKKLMVQLNGDCAETFFRGQTAENVLRRDSDFQYIKNVFHDICPTIHTLGSSKSYNPLNYWVIQAFKWEDTNHFIYSVKTAVPITTADKCLGHNFT